MTCLKRTVSILLMLIFCMGNLVVSVAADSLEAVITDTAQYVYKTVKNPQVGSIGGEWAVLGLARSGYDIPEEYYQNYF